MVEYLQSRAGNVHFFRKWKKGLCCTTLQITDNIGQARKGREKLRHGNLSKITELEVKISGPWWK